MNFLISTKERIVKKRINISETKVKHKVNNTMLFSYHQVKQNKEKWRVKTWQNQN